MKLRIDRCFQSRLSSGVACQDITLTRPGFMCFGSNARVGDGLEM